MISFCRNVPYRLSCLALFVILTASLFAQSIPAGYVQTTATIPSLADGTLGAAWTNLSSSPQLGLLGCVSTFQNTVNGNFDAYGHIAVLLADTSQICPAPSTWTFTLTFACPVGYPVSAFMLQVAVTGGGGTEDISSQISAVLPPKPCGGGPSTGVLSVGLTLPSSVFSVSGSPVTSIGTLAGAFINQSAGTVFAGPASGDPAIPTFRPIAPGDVPCGAGGINQLTGDATAGPGCETQALTLATVNSTPGTCGDSTDVCQVTTNSKGLTTHQAAIPISLSNAFTLSPTPPLPSGQYVVLYPNSVSPAGTVNCINVPVVAGIGAAASTSPYSGTVTRYASGVLPGCPGDIANTWSGATLPSGISPTNVTSVYGGMIYQTYCTLNNINHCGDLNIYSNGTQIFTSASTFPQSTITHLLASGSPAQTYDFAATTWEADSDSSAEYALNQPFGAQGWFQPFLIVYYTGTPITPPNQVLIAPPLQFNQNTLSLPLPFDSIVDNGSVNAYNSTLPGLTFLIAGTHVWLQALNSNTSTTPTFQLNGTGFYTIEGSTGAALSAGDISNLHTASLVYDLDGNWRLLNPQVSGGSGGSGFPITLGSTSIAASSTTTALTGISINGVTLNNAGSSSLFLNQAGGYSAPPGSGTVSSVSSGNLTPLFTVSVANPTSTPAFTFTLSNAAANTVFANCTGSTAAPSYCALTTAMLPAIAGNTVLGNGTASSAAPTALAMPSCSGASNALTWTTSSGFGCNTISGGSGSSGYLGTLTLSSSRNATASDCGYIIELAGFTYTLPNSALVCGSGTAPLGIAVQDTTASNTIVLAASATYNTGSTGPTLPQNYLCSIWSTSSAGVYQGCIPPVAGSNVTVTAAANEYTIAASSSGASYTNVVASSSADTTVALINAKCTSGQTYWASISLSIATGGTISSACNVMFVKGGVWTVASGQTVTFANPIKENDGPSEHFTGSGSVAFAPTQDWYLEWFGGADDGNLSANTGTDNTAAWAAGYAASTSGNLILQCGSYRFATTGPSITKSSIGITSSCLNDPLIFSSSASASPIVNISGASTSSVIYPNKVGNFQVGRAVPPNASVIGVQIHFAWAGIFEHIEVEDSTIGFDIEYDAANGIGQISNNSVVNGYSGVAQGTGSYIGYNMNGSTTGFSTTVLSNNIVIFNTSVITTTSTYGMNITGVFQDLNNDFFQTALANYGIYCSGCTQGQDDQITNATLDSGVHGIYFSGLSGNTVEIRGGWITCNTSGGSCVELVNTGGVSISDMKLYFGTYSPAIYDHNSSLTVLNANSIENNRFYGGVGLGTSSQAIKVSNKYFEVIVGNNVNASGGLANTNPMIQFVNSSYGVVQGNNLWSGTGVGIGLDSTSTNNSVGSNTLDGYTFSDAGSSNLVTSTGFQNNNSVVTSSLPTCAAGTLFQHLAVTDSTSATPGGAPTGGGNIKIGVECIDNSGTYSWIVD